MNLIPKRSTLYSIEPIGIGTSFVECLTSYTARQAAAHYLNVGTLLNWAIVPKAINFARKKWGDTYVFDFKQSSNINGTGLRALKFVELLNDYTRREDLALLTLLNWSHFLDYRKLLRPHKAWCNECYIEWSDNQLIYDPLIWAFQLSSYCTIHHTPLRTRCPSCLREQPFLSFHMRHGYCYKCGEPLFPRDCSPCENSDDDLIREWKIWASLQIKKLVESALVAKTMQIEIFINNIVGLMRYLGVGPHKFTRETGLAVSAIYKWTSTINPSTPLLVSMLKVCYRFGISIIDFSSRIFDERDYEKIKLAPPLKIGIPIIKKRTFNLHFAKKVLEEALIMEPLPLKEIARRNSLNLYTMYQNIPELCKQVSARWLEKQKLQKIERLKHEREKIRQSAIYLFKQGIFPTRRKISELISDRGIMLKKESNLVWLEILKELGLR